MTKLEVAQDEVERIDAAISSLMQERELWNGVIEREKGKGQAFSLFSAVHLSPEFLSPAQRDTAEEYGAKTNALRRFLVDRPNGVSMRDLRDEAKKHSQTDNFPYRFVDRMATAGELEKREGLLYATEKMRTVLEGKEETPY